MYVPVTISLVGGDGFSVEEEDEEEEEEESLFPDTTISLTHVGGGRYIQPTL